MPANDHLYTIFEFFFNAFYKSRGHEIFFETKKEWSNIFLEYHHHLLIKWEVGGWNYILQVLVLRLFKSSGNEA